MPSRAKGLARRCWIARVRLWRRRSRTGRASRSSTHPRLPSNRAGDPEALSTSRSSGAGGRRLLARSARPRKAPRSRFIERGILGGTCVNVGCVPSKIMIRAAHLAHLQSDHPFDGIKKRTAVLDRRALLAQQQGRVEELRHAKYESILESNPRITLLRGSAHFTMGRALMVKEPGGKEQRLRADRVLIANRRLPRPSPRRRVSRIAPTGPRPRRSWRNDCRSTSSSTGARWSRWSSGRRFCAWARR